MPGRTLPGIGMGAGGQYGAPEPLSAQHRAGPLDAQCARPARQPPARTGTGRRARRVPPLLTQEEMASKLGTVREVVGRALRSLAAEGMIEFNRHRIVILDRGGWRRKRRKFEEYRFTAGVHRERREQNQDIT